MPSKRHKPEEIVTKLRRVYAQSLLWVDAVEKVLAGRRLRFR